MSLVGPCIGNGTPPPPSSRGQRTKALVSRRVWLRKESLRQARPPAPPQNGVTTNPHGVDSHFQDTFDTAKNPKGGSKGGLLTGVVSWRSWDMPFLMRLIRSLNLSEKKTDAQKMYTGRVPIAASHVGAMARAREH